MDSLQPSLAASTIAMDAIGQDDKRALYAQPESVAQHSFRVAAVGIMLAAIEGADVGRTAALCLLHDAHETRIGDVPSVGRAYVTTAAPEAVTAHQTATMPDEIAKVVAE